MKKFLIIVIAAVGANSYATNYFFFGVDPQTTMGDPFPISGGSQRNWAAIAGSLSSISAITYENDAIGSGVTPYNPLPGVTVSTTNGGSGVSGTNQHELGWNVTPFGSQHLRFAPDFNALDAFVSFKFNQLANSFGTMYMGAQDNYVGDFSLEMYRNNSFVAGLGQSKPTPSGSLSSHSFLGFATDDAQYFFDEVRFYSRGDRSSSADHVGLDDTMFTYCQPVPEPATMAALGLGVATLLRRRRK